MNGYLKRLNFIINISMPLIIFSGIINFIFINNKKGVTKTEEFFAGLFLGMAIITIPIIIIKFFVNKKIMKNQMVKSNE